MSRKALFSAMGLVLLLFFGAGAMVSSAADKPTVSIVKAAKHDLVAESWRMNWDRTISQGVNPTRNVEYLRAEWSKESEKAIEAMVRDAVELAGGWPVKPNDVVLIKPNLVASMFFLWYSG
ncbi:MAG: hypothetical protein QHH30_09995, partial [candidate division NC10 bacterium]|nr:hypothetical protein [candidate division NC10 bacterium]